MARVTVIGGGSIGHALAALLGGRSELEVTIWGRRWRAFGARTFTCLNGGLTCAAGRAVAECDLKRAVRGSQVVILTVPTHVRHKLLRLIADDVAGCAFLLSWEGTGRFRESLRTFGIDGPVCAGLQRSPIAARLRRHGESCDLLGVRSEVVAAAVKSSERDKVRALLAALLPFQIAVAPSYEHVSASPGNPLIHPARLFSIARARSRGHLTGTDRFYADWDDDASETLLALHRDLKALRRALGLSKRYLGTLADERSQISPTRLTADIRSEERLADVLVPSRFNGLRRTLDWDHRFFREDIGEGLSYIVSLAKRVNVRMPTAESIVDWYDEIY